MQEQNENIVYLEKIPLYYFNNYIGSGANGKCYKIEDQNIIFKMFEKCKFNIDNMLYFLKMNVDSFCFPKKLIFSKNENDEYEIKGYFMNYVSGFILPRINNDIEMTKYTNSLKKVENDIKELSFNGVLVNDVNPYNIMINTEEEIKIIDTDFYEINSGEEPYKLYRENLFDYNYSIVSSINDSPEFKSGSKEIDEYYRICIEDNRMTASKFLTFLKIYLENIRGKEMKTIRDMKETLALVRKK